MCLEAPIYNFNLLHFMFPSILAVELKYYAMHKTCISGGVEMNGLHTTMIQRNFPRDPPTKEVYMFIPHVESVAEEEIADLHCYMECCKTLIHNFTINVLGGESVKISNADLFRQEVEKIQPRSLQNPKIIYDEQCKLIQFMENLTTLDCIASAI